MNSEQNTPAIDLSASATKVLAIGNFTEKATNASRRMPVMAKEVPATIRLHLSGKIEQSYLKPDMSGPVFIMNVTTTAEAKQLLGALPLGVEGMMDFNLIPLGPLTPLRLLLKD